MRKIRPRKPIRIWAGKRYCARLGSGCFHAYRSSFARLNKMCTRRCAVYGCELRQTPSGYWRDAQCLRDEVKD